MASSKRIRTMIMTFGASLWMAAAQAENFVPGRRWNLWCTAPRAKARTSSHALVDRIGKEGLLARLIVVSNKTAGASAHLMRRMLREAGVQ